MNRAPTDVRVFVGRRGTEKAAIFPLYQQFGRGGRGGEGYAPYLHSPSAIWRHLSGLRRS
jgi:hypothetical protein